MGSTGYALLDDTNQLVNDSPCYGEMNINANGTVTAIDTVNIDHLITLFGTGPAQNETYDAGSTGTISAFADYSGTVAGTVKATSVANGLTNNEIITIAGTTNYNGVYVVTRVDADNFYFTATWVANDATGNWYQGSSMKAGVAGQYFVTYSASLTAAGDAKKYHFVIYKNATKQSNTERELTVVTGANTNNVSGGGCVTLAVNDYVTLGVANETDATDITIIHSNVNINRLSS